MARKQSTRPRPVEIANPESPMLVGAALKKAGDFDRVYDQMQDELCALDCAIRTIEANDWEASEWLSSALVLLRRTYKALDLLHTKLGNDFAPHAGAQS